MDYVEFSSSLFEHIFQVQQLHRGPTFCLQLLTALQASFQIMRLRFASIKSAEKAKCKILVKHKSFLKNLPLLPALLSPRLHLPKLLQTCPQPLGCQLHLLQVPISCVRKYGLDILVIQGVLLTGAPLNYIVNPIKKVSEFTNRKNL